MAELTCKLLVIGAGPGGYLCAIRAGQLGLDTVIVESGRLGGTCLNVGCIPSKALIHIADEFHRLSGNRQLESMGLKAGRPSLDLATAVGWKDTIVSRLNQGVDGLLRKAKVRAMLGRARFLDGKTVEVQSDDGSHVVHAEAVVIATGSAPQALPHLPFGGPILSSADALSLVDVPNRLAVVGAGYIGLEIGTAFAKLGAKVTVVEAAERILPQYDAELTAPVARRLKDLGIEVFTSVQASRYDGGAKSLALEPAGEGPRQISADKVLVTVGRRPVVEGWGLEELQLAMNGRYVAIGDRCETSMRSVYAIGDVTGEPMLAHRAMAQGKMVAEIIAGLPRRWSAQCIPAVCFTDPEVVTAGLSPEQAKQEGIQVVAGSFPFRASGRAMSIAREDGFVRAVARADNHVLLGVQAVGAGISELASTFALAIEMGARIEDIAGTIHAHPTMGEAFQEASLAAIERPLHL
ncbi:dihydrolipoyl dehydrogenase [Rhodoligotrophos defluvii]|uniref:dihydrolipoyl dehydrogenase n=1 Tax=Rhodoligotrophos defluvii TaxID=2561934 RepID=UPI0010C9A5A1|nr:dihydrolipoyl dehydrogenase [Rhodoligotrophos defluvii]